jgi:vanillate O-demethylase ferredoxin subunit
MADSLHTSTLHLQIKQIRWEATDIFAFKLVHPEAQTLPAFSAGSHIDVHIGDGLIRQYSLSNDPQETHRYVIGVFATRRGGWFARLHGQRPCGQLIKVSVPRNNFALTADAHHTLLLAGGIGITPLKSMAHALSHAGASFALHYCVRSDDRIAFKDELAALPGTQFHVDGGDPSQGLNIAALLQTPQEGTHAHSCGPPGFHESLQGGHRALACSASSLRAFSSACGGCADKPQPCRR